MERNKARVMVKWYAQTYNIDYKDTFAPITKITIIRVIFSMAINLDWPLF